MMMMMMMMMMNLFVALYNNNIYVHDNPLKVYGPSPAPVMLLQLQFISYYKRKYKTTRGTIKNYKFVNVHSLTIAVN